MTRRRAHRLRSLAVLGGALLAWGVLLGSAPGQPGRVSAEDDAPPVPGPRDLDGARPTPQPAAPAPDAPAAAEDIAALVETLRPVVAEMRGLAWKQPVPAEVLTRDQLHEEMLRMAREEYPADEQARDRRILRRLGMLGPEEDHVALLLGVMREMVAGFYDTDRKRLYVIEGPVGAGRIPTLVHELVHALDDQHFDIEKMEEPLREDGDRQWAFRCLIEGTAMHIQHAYEEAHLDVARTAYQQMYAPSAEDGNDDDAASASSGLEKVPAFLFVPSLLHYRMGPHFIRAGLASRGDGDARTMIDGLYADPPQTQEQVLHPERWLDPDRRDLPRTITFPADIVAAAGEDAALLYEGPVGELDLALTLDFFLGERQGRIDGEGAAEGRYVGDRAHEAAVGWDGARMAYLARGDEPLVVVGAFAFDTPRDAAEAERALKDVVRARYGDRVDEVAKVPTADPEASLHAYTFAEGDRRLVGRLLRRGRELLWLDGAAPERSDALQAAVERTRFEQLAGDRGDLEVKAGEAGDPFAGCAFVHRRRGLGLVVPAGWRATAGGDPFLARVARGAINLQFLVADEGMTKGGLPFMLAAQLEAQDVTFDEADLVEAQVAGFPGYFYPIETAVVGPGVEIAVGLYIASDGVRTYLFVQAGPVAELRRREAEIRALINGVVSAPSY